MYGLTASKNTRFDNAHHRLEGLFGPTIFKFSYDQAEQHKLVVPLAVYWIQYAMDHNPTEYYETPTAQRRHGIWRNANRNSAIAAVAQQAVDDGRQTLIVVDTIEHGLHLRKLLPGWKFCYAEGSIDDTKRARFIAAGLLDSDEETLTAVEREALRNGFENREFLGAIATGVWSVGVSFDSLEVLVRADGGSSETASIQTPGRVCRTYGGKDYGLVVDCLDAFDSRFLKRANTRRCAYHRNSWTQFLDNGELVTRPFV
jgi:superfamily II DNA or RNA helicase